MTKRRLDPEEHALWKHVTRSVKQLGRRRADDASAEPDAAALKPKPVKAKLLQDNRNMPPGRVVRSPISGCFAGCGESLPRAAPHLLR